METSSFSCCCIHFEKWQQTNNTSSFYNCIFLYKKKAINKWKKTRALKKFIRRFLLKKKFRLKFVQFVFVCVLCSDFTKRKFSWYFRKSIWHVSIFVCWFVLFFSFVQPKIEYTKLTKPKVCWNANKNQIVFTLTGLRSLTTRSRWRRREVLCDRSSLSARSSLWRCRCPWRDDVGLRRWCDRFDRSGCFRRDDVSL